MPVRPEFAIDMHNVVASKGGHLPEFAIRFLGRFLHIDFLNEFFVKGYEGVEFCTEALKALDVSVVVEGLDNIPVDGNAYTFASNHPLGGIDGVALGSIVGNRFNGKIKYIVNDFLMHIQGLAPLCVPVNKTGGQSRELPRLINEAFSSDNNILVFPAGICSRKIKGKIQDLPWGKSFIVKSIENSRPIVPVHFIASNSKRFYRVARFCDSLHLKFNIAMALLPDEMYKARHSQFKVVFGKPIPPETFDGSKTPAQWAAWVRECVYNL